MHALIMENNPKQIIISVNLPEEIITEIMLRLPVKSLLRFKCVSKPWLFLISSYKFAKAHLKISTKNNACIDDKLIFGSRTLPIKLYTCSIQSIIEGSNLVVQVYPTINDNLLFDRVGFDCPFAYQPGDVIWLVGSCNGLVCVYFPPKIIILWNPTTRKSKRLADSGSDLGVGLYGNAFAFGYDELHDDYKVVELLWVERVAGVYETYVKVYSLRNNTWMVLSNWPGGDTFDRTGKFLNGAIHWSVWYFPVEWVIVSHDLATDTFTQLPLPTFDDYYVTVEVKNLQGCLALHCEHNGYSDVWLMKEYGVRESWTKVYRIPFDLDFWDDRFVTPRPLYLWVDGKILMNYGSSIKIYDSTYNPTFDFDTNSIVDAMTYVESLVSLTLDNEEQRD